MARDDGFDEDELVDDDTGEDADDLGIDDVDDDLGDDGQALGVVADDSDVAEDDGDDAEDDDAEDDVDEDEDEDGDDVGDDEDEEESLDVLLAREVGQDDDDLVRLDDETPGTLTLPNVPIGEGEFTCRSCFLVKRRAQLADENRVICFDCA